MRHISLLAGETLRGLRIGIKNLEIQTTWESR